MVLEHQRALARAGDPGERRQPALRELDADVLEVVLPGALHPDQVVAVGRSWRRPFHAPDLRRLGHLARASAMRLSADSATIRYRRSRAAVREAATGVSRRQVSLGRDSAQTRWSAPPALEAGSVLPLEPVRVGERTGVADDDEPVRPAALRGHAGVLGRGPARVERELHRGAGRVELDVLAAEALPRRPGRARRRTAWSPSRPRRRAAAPRRRPPGWPGRCPSSTTTRSSRSSRPGPDDAAVAPEALLDRLQLGGAGVEGAADEAVDGARLGDDEREREPAEAGRRLLDSRTRSVSPRSKASL